MIVQKEGNYQNSFCAPLTIFSFHDASRNRLTSCQKTFWKGEMLKVYQCSMQWLQGCNKKSSIGMQLALFVVMNFPHDKLVRYTITTFCDSLALHKVSFAASSRWRLAFLEAKSCGCHIDMFGFLLHLVKSRSTWMWQFSSTTRDIFGSVIFWLIGLKKTRDGRVVALPTKNSNRYYVAVPSTLE
jgi:hypothetical protein